MYSLLFNCEYGYVECVLHRLQTKKYSNEYISCAACAVAKGLSLKKLQTADAIYLTTLLVEKGATLLKVLSRYELLTPLHYYCKVGNFFLGSLAIQQGANINAVDTTGMSPLHYLFMYAKQFLPTRENILHQLSRRERYGITFTNSSDRVQLLYLLLQHDADLSLENNGNIVCLSFAPVSLMEESFYFLLTQSPPLSQIKRMNIIYLLKAMPITMSLIERAKLIIHRCGHSDLLAMVEESL
jgi:hypothetical protein